MSKREYAVTVEELWSQNQQLHAQVETLETRLARYEAQQREEAGPGRLAACGGGTPERKAEQEEDVWAEWPYCWAIAGYRFTALRLHSFHGSLHDRVLAYRNKRARRAFWQKPHPEAIEMRLVGRDMAQS